MKARTLYKVLSKNHSPQRVSWLGRGPGVVVFSCLLRKSEIAGSNSTLAFKFQRNISLMFLPRSLFKIQYCGEPPGSVLGLRPPGLKFLIPCQEGSVISPFAEGSPGPV